MPSLIIPVGFAQVAHRWRLAGDNEEMVSTHAVSLDGTADTGSEVALECATLWAAIWTATSMSNPWLYVGATAYVGQDGGPPASGEALINLAGTGGTTGLPNNTALLVRKVTALGGRRNRGRMFIPSAYLGETSVDERGFIATATLAIYQSRMNEYLNDLESSGAVGPPQLLHSEPPSVPTPISDFSVQAQVATQRQRMRR